MEFEFKKQIEVITTNDPFYDLITECRIRPSYFLEDKTQISEVVKAIGVIDEFIRQLTEEGYVEVI